MTTHRMRKDGNDHRQERVAYAAKYAGHHIHHAAEEVGGTDDDLALHAGGDDGGVGGIEAKKRFAKDAGECTHDNAENDGPDHAGIHRGKDAARFARADILSGKAGDCLLEGIHRLIDKAADVGGSGVSGDDHRAEAVD